MKQTRNETAVITTAARVTTARLAIREARPRRITSILLWAAQIPLAAIFVTTAMIKLNASPYIVREFSEIGVGQWFRYFAGTAELAGAIGLLTPWLAGLAAAGLAAVMGGATIINATVLNSVPQYRGLWMITGVLFVPCVLLAYARRKQIKALAAAIRR